jgi:hypothetical protein
MQGLCPKPLLPEHNLQQKANTKFTNMMIKKLAQAQQIFKQCGKRMSGKG